MEKKRSKDGDETDMPESDDIDIEETDEDYDTAYPEEKKGKKGRLPYRQGGKYRSTKIKPGK